MFTVAAPPVDIGEVQAATGDEHGLVDIEGSLFTARVEPGTAARPGAALRLALDAARIHYFDPGSGLRLETGSGAAKAEPTPIAATTP